MSHSLETTDYKTDDFYNDLKNLVEIQNATLPSGSFEFSVILNHIEACIYEWAHWYHKSHETPIRDLAYLMHLERFAPKLAISPGSIEKNFPLCLELLQQLTTGPDRIEFSFLLELLEIRGLLSEDHLKKLRDNISETSRDFLGLKTGMDSDPLISRRISIAQLIFYLFKKNNFISDYMRDPSLLIEQLRTVFQDCPSNYDRSQFAERLASATLDQYDTNSAGIGICTGKINFIRILLKKTDSSCLRLLENYLDKAKLPLLLEAEDLITLNKFLKATASLIPGLFSSVAEIDRSTRRCSEEHTLFWLTYYDTTDPKWTMHTNSEGVSVIANTSVAKECEQEKIKEEWMGVFNSFLPPSSEPSPGSTAAGGGGTRITKKFTASPPRSVSTLSYSNSSSSSISKDSGHEQS